MYNALRISHLLASHIVRDMCASAMLNVLCTFMGNTFISHSPQGVLLGRSVNEFELTWYRVLFLMSIVVVKAERRYHKTILQIFNHGHKLRLCVSGVGF